MKERKGGEEDSAPIRATKTTAHQWGGRKKKGANQFGSFQKKKKKKILPNVVDMD